MSTTPLSAIAAEHYDWRSKVWQMPAFGELLREFRAAAGLTQEDVATLAGLSARGISDLERGARRSPHPTTVRRLAAAIGLLDEDRLALEAAAHQCRAPTRRRSTADRGLPTPFTSLVGRADELVQIRSALRGSRLITLTGVGGIGKTRLAIAIAEAAPAEVADKVVMVELGALVDPLLVPHQLAAAVGVREHGPQSTIDGLLVALANTRLLIVLDSCEHLLEACADVVTVVLGHCAGVRILATSRQPLGLANEVVWTVPALTVNPPDEQLVHRLTRYGAVQLFVDRVRAVWPSFVLSRVNAAAVARVCRRLEGIPLAIELAAARTRVLSIEQIDARLEDRYRLLVSGSAEAPARHQTLRAAVEWSYALLSAHEQLLFERLSVFRGGALLEAVEAVCGTAGIESVEIADILQSLVEKSLVVAHREMDGRIRFSQLDTLRDYAHARCHDRAEVDMLRARHLSYHVQLAERAAPELQGPQQIAWLDRLQAEHDNVRAALSWVARTEAGVKEALRLAASLSMFYVVRGSVGEGRNLLDNLLARNVPVAPAMRVKALNGAGALAFQSGDYDRALTLHREALAIARQLGHHGAIAAQLNQLGIATSECGDRAGAALLFDESLTLYRALDDRLGVAGALGNLGITARLEGRLDQARQHLEQAVTQHKALRAHRATANTLHSLGNVVLDGGDLSEAARCFREALALADGVRDWTGVARCIESLAEIAARQRRAPARAAQLLGAAEALREMTGIPVTSSGRAMHERRIGLLEKQLRPSALAAAWKRGRSLSGERAVRLALEA
jgi:predicted ATPase/DNA-binding XRE family transcriptional regulator